MIIQIVIMAFLVGIGLASWGQRRMAGLPYLHWVIYTIVAAVWLAFLVLATLVRER